MTFAGRAIRLGVVSGLLMTLQGAALLAKDAAPTIDACALLDASAIQGVLGVPVEKGERRDSGIEPNGAYSSACVWILRIDRNAEPGRERGYDAGHDESRDAGHDESRDAGRDESRDAGRDEGGDSGRERRHEADPRAPLGGKSFVILNALRWPQGSDGARTYLQAFREASDSGVLPSKPSPRQFGDEALWWGDGLAVRRRDVSFGVSIFIPHEAAGEAPRRAGEREERLATMILSRLDAQARSQ